MILIWFVVYVIKKSNYLKLFLFQYYFHDFLTLLFKDEFLRSSLFLLKKSFFAASGLLRVGNFARGV